MAKPTVDELGIDPDAQHWQRSGEGDGAIEIAFARAPGTAHPGTAHPGTKRPGDEGASWVLMRVTGDPAHRVLVFDRNEWECFVDGARKGEFDDAAGNARRRTRY